MTRLQKLFFCSVGLEKIDVLEMSSNLKSFDFCKDTDNIDTETVSESESMSERRGRRRSRSHRTSGNGMGTTTSHDDEPPNTNLSFIEPLVVAARVVNSKLNSTF